MHESDDWRPDRVQRPDYPPPERANGDQKAWQACPMSHRAGVPTLWEQLQTPRLVWPGGLTPKAKTELLRCAEAYEATAARLRRIVREAC